MLAVARTVTCSQTRCQTGRTVLAVGRTALAVGRTALAVARTVTCSQTRYQTGRTALAVARTVTCPQTHYSAHTKMYLRNYCLVRKISQQLYQTTDQTCYFASYHHHSDPLHTLCMERLQQWHQC